MSKHSLKHVASLGFVRKSGAGDAGGCVLCLKSLEMASLKLVSSRDFDGCLMVWN